MKEQYMTDKFTYNFKSAWCKFMREYDDDDKHLQNIIKYKIMLFEVALIYDISRSHGRV
jgi:hypothetical protein